MLFVFLCVMAGVPSSPRQDNSLRVPRGDSLVVTDTVDTMLTGRQVSRAELKRDTTTMDSLALAIYKHNKAIDDSLTLDSLNRKKKNGIDSPVEFSAKDSII